MSVVVFGLAIAFPFGLQRLAAVALAGFFTLFHGYVHGAEMPAAATALYYTMIGLGLGLLFGLETGRLWRRVVQAGGGAMAVFGAAILIGVL